MVARAGSYPRHLMTVAVLIGDAPEDKVKQVDRAVRGLKGYRKLLLLHKDFHNKYAKHEAWLQLSRRQALAKIRNFLIITALKDEQWVLWLDADIYSYPPDTIQR